MNNTLDEKIARINELEGMSEIKLIRSQHGDEIDWILNEHDTYRESNEDEESDYLINGIWYDLTYGEAISFENESAKEKLFADKDMILSLLPFSRTSTNQLEAGELILENIASIPKVFFEDPIFTSHLLSTFPGNDISDFIPHELLRDKVFVLRLLKNKWWFIDSDSFAFLAKKISADFWYDKAFRDLYFYVGGNRAYEALPDDLRWDPDIFLSATFPELAEVSNYYNIWLYANAPESIRSNLKVMRKIISKYGGYWVVFDTFSEEQKKDSSFILSLLDKHGQCPSGVLRYISPVLLEDYVFLSKIDEMQDWTAWVDVYNMLTDIWISWKDNNTYKSASESYLKWKKEVIN